METAMLRAYPLVSGGMVLSPDKGEKVHLSRACGTRSLPSAASPGTLSKERLGSQWAVTTVSLCGLQRG